jgi:hypothetical protein
MTQVRPVTFEWDGEAMIPLSRFCRLCDQQFAVHERYTLIPHEERSSATHRHYFAALYDAWLNLPEREAERWPTSEHFRKWLLIQAGYADERSIVCPSKAAALKVAAFVKPMDEHAVVVVSESIVKVFTAQSQSMRAMGPKAFQDSKQKVLDLAAEMVGVKPQTLSSEAGRAA